MSRLSPVEISKSVDFIKECICAVKENHAVIPFFKHMVDIIEQLLRDKNNAWSKYEPNQFDADRLCREINRIEKRLNDNSMSDLKVMAYNTRLTWLISECKNKYQAFI